MLALLLLSSPLPGGYSHTTTGGSFSKHRHSLCARDSKYSCATCKHLLWCSRAALHTRGFVCLVKDIQNALSRPFLFTVVSPAIMAVERQHGENTGTVPLPRGIWSRGGLFLDVTINDFQLILSRWSLWETLRWRESLHTSCTWPNSRKVK